MRIAVVANTSWYLFNFRMNLMRALDRAGHQVLAVSPAGDCADRIVADGFRHLAVAFSQTGIRPLRECETVYQLRRAFLENGIEVVLSYTPRGNVYSGLACIGLGTVTLPNVSGLGHAFTYPSVLTLLVKALYRLVMRSSPVSFFQNDEDLNCFVNAGIVTRRRAERLPGSGVDLLHFSMDLTTDHSQSNGAVFLLVARLLWAKGVGDFVSAARLVREKCPDASFQLLGPIREDAPGAINRSTVDRWVTEGIIEYIGESDDVRACLAAADCVVLPSYYREGVPRALLEAAAMGRFVITTDLPGCRDTVDDGETGLLCEPRNAPDLANKMLRFLSFDHATRIAMGHAARRKMEAEFDERIVIDRYLAAVAAIAIERA